MRGDVVTHCDTCCAMTKWHDVVQLDERVQDNVFSATLQPSLEGLSWIPWLPRSGGEKT